MSFHGKYERDGKETPQVQLQAAEAVSAADVVLIPAGRKTW